MNVRLALFRPALASGLKLRMLNELAVVTALAFQVDVPIWAGRTFRSRLTEYARFTAERAELLASTGDTSAIEAAKERLRSGALDLGASLRRTLHTRNAEQAFEALTILYGGMGIDMRAEADGEVAVARCFFAGFYRPDVCRIVEALDQGLVSGLFDGASLEFSRRLTEGRSQCRACLRLAEAEA